MRFGSQFGTTGVYAGVSWSADTTFVDQTGSVKLTAGNASQAFVQIGAASGNFDPVAGNLGNGNIVVRAGKDVILTSGGADADDAQTSFAYAQIGHGGLSFTDLLRGSIDGNIEVVSGISEKGDVTLTNAAGASVSNYAQIGHGTLIAHNGQIADNDISGNVVVSAYNDCLFPRKSEPVFPSRSEPPLSYLS